MNKQEAQTVLRQQLTPYAAQSYDQLKSLIGGEHVSKARGPSGAEYCFDLYASYVDDADGNTDTIEVEGTVTEAKGRWWYRPSVEGSFAVESNGKKYSRCSWLLMGAEPSAPPNGGPAERLGNSGVGGGPPSVS